MTPQEISEMKRSVVCVEHSATRCGENVGYLLTELAESIRPPRGWTEKCENVGNTQQHTVAGNVARCLLNSKPKPRPPTPLSPPSDFAIPFLHTSQLPFHRLFDNSRIYLDRLRSHTRNFKHFKHFKLELKINGFPSLFFFVFRLSNARRGLLMKVKL